MPERIDLAELRAARKMEPKELVLGDQRLVLPADIGIDVGVAIIDNRFEHALELFFGGADWRERIAPFHLTITDLIDILRTAYMPNLQKLGESLASATSSNGTGAR
jgi:hypothetical protein